MLGFRAAVRVGVVVRVRRRLRVLGLAQLLAQPRKSGLESRVRVRVRVEGWGNGFGWSSTPPDQQTKGPLQLKSKPRGGAEAGAEIKGEGGL